MISLHQIVTFGIAAGILIAVPGPSVVLVVGRALSYGRRTALAGALGDPLGPLTIVVLVAAGLGVVVAESIVVFTVLKLAGAAYLVYVGVQAIRHRSGFRRSEDAGALLPRLVVREAGHVSLLLLGPVAVVIGLVSDSRWAVVASRVRESFTATPRRGEMIGVVGGTSMIGLGSPLAVSGRE